MAKEIKLKVQISLSELSSLVKRINVEIKELMAAELATDPALAFVVVGSCDRGEGHLCIVNNTKMIEVSSVVIPFDIEAGTSDGLVSLSAAKLEVKAAWSMHGESPWMLNQSFADSGKLVICLPSLDTEHIELAVKTAARCITSYLNVQIETC